jgi:hypothetical protein
LQKIVLQNFADFLAKSERRVDEALRPLELSPGVRYGFEETRLRGWRMGSEFP